MFHGLFLALLVLNPVAGFQVLGTLMAVGVMMLPAVAARCWARTLPGLLLLAAAIGAVCAPAGIKFVLERGLTCRSVDCADGQHYLLFSILFGTRSGLAHSLRALFNLAREMMKRTGVILALALSVVAQGLWQKPSMW